MGRKEQLLRPEEWYEFTADRGDELAEELGEVHSALSPIVDSYRIKEAVKQLPIVTVIAKSNQEKALRYVAALTRYCMWHDRRIEEIREVVGRGGGSAYNVVYTVDFKRLWPRREAGAMLLTRIMLRHLPLSADLLREMVDWAEVPPLIYSTIFPVKGVVDALLRALQREGRERIGKDAKRMAEVLKAEGKYAAQLDQAMIEKREAAGEDAGDIEAEKEEQLERADKPAAAGDGRVLRKLKDFLRIPVQEAEGAGGMDFSGEMGTEIVGVDQFELRADSKFSAEHALLTSFFAQAVGQVGYSEPKLEKTESGREILKLDGRAMASMVLACSERLTFARFTPESLDNAGQWQSKYTMRGLLELLLTRPVLFDRDELFDFLLWSSAVERAGEITGDRHLTRWLKKVEAFGGESPLTEGERHVLYRLRARLVRDTPLGGMDERVAQLTTILKDGLTMYLVPSEKWAEGANWELAGMKIARRNKWTELLKHARTATGATPTAKWMGTAGNLVREVGKTQVVATLVRWFDQATELKAGVPVLFAGYVGNTRDGEGVMNESNGDVLRGLLWMAGAIEDVGLARGVSGLVLSSLKKLPGVGPRAVKVANAGVFALGRMTAAKDREVAEAALGQLVRLGTKITFRGTLAQVEKAMTAAAEKLGMTREELEEMAVPTYGFDNEGRREEVMEGCRCEMRLEKGEVVTEWTNEKGKRVKSVPGAVKAAHREDLKELADAAKDAAGMLAAQKERLDRLMGLPKVWEAGVFRERYVDHPIVGHLARRLIWVVDDKPVLFQGTVARDVEGREVNVAAKGRVQMWHPIGRSVEEVVAWRERLEKVGVTQPFKQAHREVYLLTEAERRTETYSNRFAAHIVKQHQFHALAAARGWRNKLRLMVDDVYPPATKDLPAFGLRAEWWVEGIGEGFGTDTTESGAYLRLTTDQLRFYQAGSAQRLAHASGGGYGGVAEETLVRLEAVPALALSEVMRDVDLFVGVASVANDPTWADGGPEGRHQVYWQSYSFGELGASAQVRRGVLERLLPRMTKLAGKWELADRFLKVKGKLRTYKIHLGSGNILMEPNDQYLCIVPAGRREEAVGYLPFEGDGQMSVILSKALLLVDDDRITDPSIVRQLK